MAIFTAIGSLAFTAAASVGFTTAVATTIGLGAASLARGLAVSVFLNAVTPKPSIPKEQIRATINQSAGQRTRLYGQGLLGGVRAFWEVSGNKLYQIVLLNSGAVGGLIGYRIDGKPVTVDVNGVVDDGVQQGVAQFDFINGSPSSTATLYGSNYADVIAAFPGVWAGDWLTNQATMMAVFTKGETEDYLRAFPRGVNTNIQAEIQGSDVIDFRTGLINYSDLSANVIADYLINGYGLSFGDLDADLFEAFANYCDEDVALSGGGTEKRYRTWGIYGFEEQPKSVLARLKITCDAEVFQTAEGKVGIMGGRYVTPDVTIKSADIMSFDIVEGVAELERITAVKAKFTSPEHAYQDIDAATWGDPLGSKVKDIPLDMVPSHAQARGLMKGHFYKSNRPFSLKIKTNLVGIKAKFPRGDSKHTIRVQWDDLGFDEDCEVVSFDGPYCEHRGDGVKLWFCDISLVGIDDEARTYDAATEAGTPPTVPVELDPEAIPIPTITSLTQFASGSGVGVAVVVSDILRPDLDFQAQIRAVGGTYSAMVATEFRAESTGRTVGTTYEVRVRYGGGDWSATSPITIT